MNTTVHTPRPWIIRQSVQFGRDLGYLLPLLLTATVSFSVGVSLVAASIGLLIVWIGVPLAVGTLWTMRGLAQVERVRLGWLGGSPVTGAYPPPAADASRMRRFFHPFTVAQMWLDLLHGIVTFPLAVASWSITVTWTAVALGGSTAWFWERFVDQGDQATDGILGWLTLTSSHVLMGLVALVTLPFVVRGLAALHLMIGRALLGSSEAARLRTQVARLQRERGAAASAESTALRRIERDLHDGPQQRLIRLQLDLQRADRAIDADPVAAHGAIADAQTQAVDALAELRALTRGFAPPLLAERGLVAAVESLAERSTVPVRVAADVRIPLGTGVETAAYFVVAEALANVAKHAGASSAEVRLAGSDGSLAIEVVDDGRGGAHLAKGHGLAGLEQRVTGAGGSLAVTDAEGSGTVLTATLPLG